MPVDSERDFPTDPALKGHPHDQCRRGNILRGDSDRLVERDLLGRRAADPSAENELTDLGVDVLGTDDAFVDRYAQVVGARRRWCPNTN